MVALLWTFSAIVSVSLMKFWPFPTMFCLLISFHMPQPWWHDMTGKGETCSAAPTTHTVGQSWTDFYWSHWQTLLPGIVPDQIYGAELNWKPFNLKDGMEQERTPLVIKASARTEENSAGAINQAANNENLCFNCKKTKIICRNSCFKNNTDSTCT